MPDSFAGSPAAAYTLACPDLVEIVVAGRPALSGRFALGPDGCVPVAGLEGTRLDGLTPALVAERVAASAGLPRQQVRVRVEEYRSRQVFLLGPVVGSERAVPYQGPETVIDLLRRCGGVTPAADHAAIHVVRSHVANGRRPEVFPVDLEAILLRGDAATNVRIQPYDQVYVGESQLASLTRHLPFSGK
ncbi:MAG: hypothetical protein U0746_05650 [Gemmataceae bacterium]